MLARLHLRPHHRSRALACLANGSFGEQYGPLGTEHRVFEAYFKVYGNIAPAASARARLPCKKVGKDIAHVKTEPSVEAGERILILREVESWTGALEARPAAAEHPAVAVVLGALFVVREDRVCFARFFKFFRIAASVLVRVVLMGEFVEGFLYFFLRCVFADAQHFVIVFFTSHICFLFYFSSSSSAMSSIYGDSMGFSSSSPPPIFLYFLLSCPIKPPA